MNPVWAAIWSVTRRVLRSRRATGLLRRLDVDAGRYWLLVDLFGQLSQRGELMGQLGSNGGALQVAGLLYAALAAIGSLVMVLAQPPVTTYLTAFLGLSAFLMLSILLAETGNSLVNPEEGLVLVHQPVNGATYTAAKLTHLARIVLYLVPAINGIPALAGLLLGQAPWYYPLIHLSAAFGVGAVAALLCCALFGWLMRLLPPNRLKAAGQFAGIAPVLLIMIRRPAQAAVEQFQLAERLPTDPLVRGALWIAGGAAALGVVALGLRSLSADYLIRVSTIARGGAGRKRDPGSRGGSRLADVAAAISGGQPGRAGYDYVSRMIRRDFNFWRQLAPMLLLMAVWLALLLQTGDRGWQVDAFSGGFTTLHVLPHMLGFLLLLTCVVLPYSSDFKGAWTFLLVPSRAFDGFARGVHAALWLRAVVIPHMLVLVLLAVPWGVFHAALFAAFSLMVVSLYLAIALRWIGAVPFSKQVDPKHGTTLMGIMLVAAIVLGIAVALQYYFVFRSIAAVAAVTLTGGVAGFLLTRWSAARLADDMRFGLAQLASETGALYREIDV